MRLRLRLRLRLSLRLGIWIESHLLAVGFICPSPQLVRRGGRGARRAELPTRARRRIRRPAHVGAPAALSLLCYQLKRHPRPHDPGALPALDPQRRNSLGDETLSETKPSLPCLPPASPERSRLAIETCRDPVPCTLYPVPCTLYPVPRAIETCDRDLPLTLTLTLRLAIETCRDRSWATRTLRHLPRPARARRRSTRGGWLKLVLKPSDASLLAVSE